MTSENEVDISLRALLALFVIGFGVWLVFSWLKYDKTAGQTEAGLRKGSRQMVELTLVREDRERLDCASDLTPGGLACGFSADGNPRKPPVLAEKTLHPYCNVKNEILLAAGLWQSPALQGELPTKRFTVVCNYDVVAVVKNVSLRWIVTDKFAPAAQALAVGAVSDCEIPQ
jgi:hypothetical protein